MAAKKRKKCQTDTGKLKTGWRYGLGGRCLKAKAKKKSRARKPRISYSTGSSYNKGYEDWKKGQAAQAAYSTGSGYASGYEAWKAKSKKGKKSSATVNGARRRRRRRR